MWPYPKVIVHRGGGSLAPENTMAAFEYGLNCGFHAVEFDVMLTKDKVPVVIHDEELGRTVVGNGRVCDMFAEDLFELDAGSWFAPEFASSRVPSYRQVLEFCAKHDIWMNVEIKPAIGYEEITGQIVAEMTRDFYLQLDQLDKKLPLFSSFQFEALAAAKLAAPTVPRALLYRHIPNSWQTTLRELDAIAVHAQHQYLTQTMAKEIKQAGVGLACFTVNELARAHLLKSWGVDAFFTDRIDFNWFEALNLIPSV